MSVLVQPRSLVLVLQLQPPSSSEDWLLVQRLAQRYASSLEKRVRSALRKRPWKARCYCVVLGQKPKLRSGAVSRK